MSECLRNLFNDLEVLFPLLNNTLAPYIYFDNAASTPPFKAVINLVNKFVPWYSSVHRGMGLKSQVATEIYDTIHQEVLNFVGADPETHTTIFLKNTTEAINKVAHRYDFRPGDAVITTWLEHHSNLLPWVKNADVHRLNLTPEGTPDFEHLHYLLQKLSKRVKLVAITGASNVTGLIPDIYTAARMAHKYGCRILVDGAQLVPHRHVVMHSVSHPEHIDFLAFSGHKMYAPFGTGVLVGPKDFFRHGDPEYIGGGTVRYVLGKEIIYEELPDKEEAGSPNLIGAVALWQAMRVYQEIGYPIISAHEQSLVKYALNRLKALPFLEVYGANLNDVNRRLGVISFNIKGIAHNLVAAILGNEGGIGVRSGCFCAQPYISKLLGLSLEQKRRIEKAVKRDMRGETPGMVRISFGMYNTIAEIDKCIEWLEKIHREEQKKGFSPHYILDPQTGAYHPSLLNQRKPFIPKFNV